MERTAAHYVCCVTFSSFGVKENSRIARLRKNWIAFAIQFF